MTFFLVRSEIKRCSSLVLHQKSDYWHSLSISSFQYHPEHKVMYAYGGDQWIAYDNVETIGIKAQYIKDKVS